MLTYKALTTSRTMLCALLILEATGLANEIGNSPCPTTYTLVPGLFFTPETSYGGGSALIVAKGCSREGEPKEKQSALIPAYFHTAKNQSIARLFGLGYLGDWRVDAVLARTVYPDKFFGTGNATDLAAEELFLERYMAANIDIQYAVLPDTYFGPAYRFDIANIEQQTPGGLLTSGKIRGANRGKLQAIGASLVFDGRDNEFSPESGWRMDAAWIPYRATFGSNFTFDHYSFRQRLYSRLMPRHILAAEVRFELLTGDPPFRKLALLGGQYLLPGYFLGRYRDKSLVATQLQYRYGFNDRAAIAFLYGIGSVAADFAEQKTAQRHQAYSIGLRYLLDKTARLPLRLDYGRGEDSDGIYFGAGEIF
jgi:hypothetical protein